MNDRSRIDVLFVPHPMPSHLIPLAVLARRLAGRTDFGCHFLLPRELHSFARHLGLQVLDIDRQLQDGIRPEMRAISACRPQVVVDDLSPTTALLVRLVDLPRVAVVRKGLFPGDRYLAGQRHSSDVAEQFAAMKTMNLKGRGLWEPSDVSDLFVGQVNLIPSIPEVEPLPEALHRRTDGDGPCYLHIGPLLLDDREVMANIRHLDLAALAGRDAAGLKSFATLSAQGAGVVEGLKVFRFLSGHPGRTKIYFNLGLAYPPRLFDRRIRLVQAMLATGAVVISNVDAPGLTPAERERFFAAPYLPMHNVAAAVDLMVHQCGSGTYAYQLLHERPAIALGSGRYDRDLVAARLEELGAARHLPVEAVGEEDLGTFKDALCRLSDPDSHATRAQRDALRTLSRRMREAQKAFAFDEILRQAVAGRTVAAREMAGVA